MWKFEPADDVVCRVSGPEVLRFNCLVVVVGDGPALDSGWIPDLCDRGFRVDLHADQNVLLFEAEEKLMPEMFLKDYFEDIDLSAFRSKKVDSDHATLVLVTSKIRLSQGGQMLFKLPLLSAGEKSHWRISFDCLLTDDLSEKPIPKIDPCLTVAIDTPEYPGGLIGYVPHQEVSPTGRFMTLNFVTVGLSDLYFQVRDAIAQQDYEQAGKLVDEMDKRQEKALPDGWVFTREIVSNAVAEVKCNVDPVEPFKTKGPV